AQIDHPVNWTDTIRYLMGKGETEYLELGPGHVLNDLINQIKRKADPLIVEEKIENVIEEGKQVNEQQVNFKHSLAGLYLSASSLGSDSFKRDYNLKYAYLTGGMYRGIASVDLVERIGKKGMMGFYGSGGLHPMEIEEAILTIQKKLNNEEPY